MKPSYTFEDARQILAVAERHADAWNARKSGSSESEAEAFQHLAHAVGALERLSSASDTIRGALAAEQVAHQTDQADTLSAFWDENVGDREYGIGGAL